VLLLARPDPCRPWRRPSRPDWRRRSFLVSVRASWEAHSQVLAEARTRRHHVLPVRAFDRASCECIPPVRRVGWRELWRSSHAPGWRSADHVFANLLRGRPVPDHTGCVGTWAEDRRASLGRPACPIDTYSDAEILRLAQWIRSDDVLQTEDELLQETMHERRVEPPGLAGQFSALWPARGRCHAMNETMITLAGQPGCRPPGCAAPRSAVGS
jgi:hypothetical protein